jgi:uncharacterized Zn finger protein (UPF0148 family)
MPLVTRTVILYIDDELIEVDIEIDEPVKQNVCRLCEKVELAGDNEIICPECWLSVEVVEPKNEAHTQISEVEDDIISYRSFKEIVSRERNQSEVSEISEISITSETSETNEK